VPPLDVESVLTIMYGHHGAGIIRTLLFQDAKILLPYGIQVAELIQVCIHGWADNTNTRTMCSVGMSGHVT